MLVLGLLGASLAAQLVAAYLHLPDPSIGSGVANVPFLLSEWSAVCAACIAVFRSAHRTLLLVLPCAALIGNAVGDTLSTVSPAPFPSLADVAYLAFYVLMLATLVVLIARRVRTHDRFIILDVVISALGASSVLVLFLTPVFDAAAAGGSLPAISLSLSYPLLDALLIAGVISFRAHESSRTPWFFLVTGLLLFTVADVIYALQLLEGSFVGGTVLDVAWGVGVLLMAVWVCQASGGGLRSAPPGSSSSWGTIITGSAVLGAVGVLIAASVVSATRIAVVLAGATLAVTVVPLVLRRRDAKRVQERDLITGLRSRWSFEAEVGRTLDSGGTGTLALLILDDLRGIEDQMGSSAGEQFLRHQARTLLDVLPAGVQVARLGEDQFAAFLPPPHSDAIAPMGERLRARLAEPMQLDGVEVRARVRFGTATAPRDGRTLPSLLQRARTSARAPSARGNRQRPSSSGTGAGGFEMLHELRSPRALRQIVLQYQPQLALASNEIDRVEALVRWEHPTRGLLHPGQFLAVLEASGSLTEWSLEILRQAIHQCARWKAAGVPLAVAVNVAGETLDDARFSDALASLIRECELPPSMLTVEVTEQQLLENPTRTADILASLRELGVRTSLDDFGTGFNSLASLRELGVDELKIDRSFVHALVTDARSRALVQSVLTLAGDLGIETVAEGVETREQLDLLRDMQCTFAQGYFISRPLLPEGIDGLERRFHPN